MKLRNLELRISRNYDNIKTLTLLFKNNFYFIKMLINYNNFKYFINLFNLNNYQIK